MGFFNGAARSAKGRKALPKPIKIVFLVYFLYAAGDDACMKAISCHGHC
jgi:hypothetical protein